MENIFDHTRRPDADLLFTRNDPNDPRLGEVVHTEPERYERSQIVIVGCPQDEGVKRNGGRPGAAEAPSAVRRQFYKLTPFNLKRSVFDLGNVTVEGTLEEIHDRLKAVVTQLLKDDKRVIILGGGNDISYADGSAMSDVYGAKGWIGINVDSHLDVRLAEQRNSGTPYRQLLDEGLLVPTNFYEVGYQSHYCSPVYYDYIRRLGVNRMSLEMVRSRAAADLELKDAITQKFIGQSSSVSTFFGFDMDVVRSADAPGTSAPSPLGLRAGEFIQIVKYAASLAHTRIVEFTEVNPKFDVDDRTAKLVAIAMHRFCTGTE